MLSDSVPSHYSRAYTPSAMGQTDTRFEGRTMHDNGPGALHRISHSPAVCIDGRVLLMDER